jgi:integrase
MTLGSPTSNHYIQRKSLARKLNDSRILKVSLHSLRSQKGTTEYHETKDIIHAQQLLGHCDIKSTMICINLEQALYSASNDEFDVKTAK